MGKTDLSAERAIEVITKEAMQQYEQVRQAGPCNMFDYHCVLDYADSMEMYALASLTDDEYMLIIANFGLLMKFHRVTQEATNG